MLRSNPGPTCSRLGREDEAASKDACHTPTAPPALEPRGWLPHRGGLLHLLAGTVRDHPDNCFSALFGSAFGAEAALSMRACCPSWVKAFHFSSTRTPQPIVILLVSAQHRRFVAARLQGCLAIPGITILALSSIAVLSQATPKCVSPRKCRGSALVSSGPPPTFSILANCGGIVGVSFWGIVLVVGFFLEAALFDNCLTSALRSLREALERAKCSPAVCLRPKKGTLPSTLRGQQKGKPAGHPQNA